MDLRAEQKAISRNGAKAAAVYLIVCGASVAWLSKVMDFPTSMEDRLAFGLQISIAPLACLFVAVILVSRGRYHSSEDISGSAAGPPSSKIALRVAFLQNTLEQAVLAIGANLIFVSLVEGPWLALPLAGAFLFACGRISFFRGYPAGAGGRAFGMVLTILPALCQLLGSAFVSLTPIPAMLSGTA